MNTDNRSLHKKTKKIEIGGIKCPCCVPIPISRRKTLKRDLNKDVRRTNKKIINQEHKDA